MKKQTQNTHVFIASVVLYVVLLGIIAIVWSMIVIPPEHIDDVFLGLLLFCGALVTVTVYQSFRIHESAEVLAEGMAEHMTQDILIYSRELFSELYRNSPVPYVVIEESGSVESINFATARLFNVTQEALDGQNIFSFIEGEDEDKLALIPEYFKEGKFVNDVEAQIRRPDGATRWVMLSLFSFKDTHAVRKGLLTLVDITKQKLIDKAKTEFVSLASHQLRTPISGMKWNIELLLTGGLERMTDVQRTYIEKINHGLVRMDMLVGDFLNVSKFELGTLVPNITNVDFKPFLQSVYEEHRVFAEDKSVQIQTDWEGAPEQIRSDTHMLHMIVSNLLGNAVKYTEAGGVVQVSVERHEPHFILTITDTGIGIPLNEQEMIFSKLYRASNARTQVTDGTGLGLYIVKEAAEVLGGGITFTSAEGAGSSFVVTLPIG